MKPSPLDAIDRHIADVERQIGDLKARLEDLRHRRLLLLSLPETCPSCGGEGRERYTDAAGSGDWRECKTCGGLGRIGPMKCGACGRVIGTDMISWRRLYAGSPIEHHRCPWCGNFCEVMIDAGQGD